MSKKAWHPMQQHLAEHSGPKMKTKSAVSAEAPAHDAGLPSAAKKAVKTKVPKGAKGRMGDVDDDGDSD